MSISDLSFVSVTDTAKDFWTIKATGDWGADNQTGKAAADELLAEMAGSGVPITLSSVARAIVEKGAWTGVEVGFFTRIGAHTIS